MGRIVVTEYISVDGVIEAPGGEEDYEHVGWAMRYSRGPRGEQFKYDETMPAEAMLLGRITYEGFAKAWPAMEGEFADKFNSMPKYVISSTLMDPEWENTTVLGGDGADAAAKLRDSVAGDVVVHGSAQLAQALFERGLVDELRLMTYPLLLGTGKRLFGDLADVTSLELVESEKVDDGITTAVYRPVR